MKLTIPFSAFHAIAVFAFALISINANSDQSALWDCKGITIDQAGPSTVSVGGRLDYEIHVKNDGSCDLTGATVVDFIPRMSVFYQASPEPTDYPETHPVDHTAPDMGTLDNEHPVSKIEWKNVTLGSGKDISFKVSAHVRSPEARVLLNTVCFENNLSGRICSQAETTVTR